MTGERKKILLVEDDLVLVKILERRLSREEGFEVMVAVSEEEALHKASEGRPDLIFLDLMLPHSHGFTILRKLKSLPETKEIPVVIVSALGQDEHIAQGMKLGAKEYLIKGGSSLEDLVKKVRTFLAESQSDKAG